MTIFCGGQRVSALAILYLVLTTLGLTGCAKNSELEAPNVVWIMLDTVRADRLALFGHTRPTTPFLDSWADDARVYENCLSVASTTVPAHASMFTNLLPHEHGADNSRSRLADEFTTLPEIFHDADYQTFLYAENPYIARDSGFDQGFDAVHHPWDEIYRDEVAAIITNKMPSRFRHPTLNQQLHKTDIKPWYLSACGELGQRLLNSWLEDRDRERPAFVFMNFMESHQPTITPESYRRLMMMPLQVNRSYEIDTSPTAIWTYCFGLSEYEPQDIEIMRAVYDAAIAELDDIIRQIVAILDAQDLGDNTIIVVSGDHGEHLFEHHLLDHQYSLYQELLDVPLVIHYPRALEPGREARPVQNIDLFPTILELAGLTGHTSADDYSRSLLTPLTTRARMADYPSAHELAIDDIMAMTPGWEPGIFRRSLRSLQVEPYKFIWASDGTHELYNIVDDPQEQHDLASAMPEQVEAMSRQLETMRAKRHTTPIARPDVAPMTDQQQRALRSLGYLGSSKKATTDTTGQ